MTTLTCRLWGHQPSVTDLRVPGLTEPTIVLCGCLRCGDVVSVEAQQVKPGIVQFRVVKGGAA